MERTSLEGLVEKQLQPSNVVLQLKQVNEEIYSCQGGQMSNARGRMDPRKKVNNLIKSMMPLMRAVDKL